ncbi:transcription factor domain-containing protein [Aspergillus homomorphus CBS 101889]|uniref:Transcription factor domain-containing protein n=1 Tax=Aspergillus homomorphus (strain CBS 101889) TaxID=1450537 RepID=A0A395HPS4_ASPHC|nr:hypothetical protein BO97DRAFT_427036 [Aspergillus homomorphus CBS 101889]RAL09827.1 hypothetical protein BO97DRAFT_427036 [Aspergillus homomorphus CBS 101889]
MPLGIQDSDIDVCPPLASEIHVPGSYERINAIRRALSPSSSRSSPIAPADQLIQPDRSAYGQPAASVNYPASRSTTADNEQHRRELVFASYVESGKLTGRALELFHKSILSLDRDSAARRTSTGPCSDSSTPAAAAAATAATDPNTPFNFAPFFTVLYQHLILLINRPSLSLNPSSPEFCSGLQTCTGAAREILSALTTQQESGQAFFRPGFLSAAWMSGLMLASACQLQQYVLTKASQTEPATRNSYVDASASAQQSLDPGVLGHHHERASRGGYNELEDRVSLSEGFSALEGVDVDMIDLLQGSNFDVLADMFGQQYPYFLERRMQINALKHPYDNLVIRNRLRHSTAINQRS